MHCRGVSPPPTVMSLLDVGSALTNEFAPRLISPLRLRRGGRLLTMLTHALCSGAIASRMTLVAQRSLLCVLPVCWELTLPQLTALVVSLPVSE